MMHAACGRPRRQRDWADRRVDLLPWGVPVTLVVLGIAWSGVRAWLWIPSLVLAGAACVANAARCGRLHCFLTGPVFLIAAVAELLDAMKVIPIAWAWILAFVVGGTVLGYGLERVPGPFIAVRPGQEGGCA